jgi:hypothetical protein
MDGGRRASGSWGRYLYRRERAEGRGERGEGRGQREREVRGESGMESEEWGWA